MKIVPIAAQKFMSRAKRKLAHRRKRDERKAALVGATPERMGQNGGVITDHIPFKRNRAACECQLDQYFKRGKIDDGEFRAGMKFREAWLVSSEGVKTSDSIDRERIDNAQALTAEDAEERETWARRIINEAYQELPPGQILLVINVCGYDQFVGTDYDIRVFRRGLDRLARLWSFCSAKK